MAARVLIVEDNQANMDLMCYLLAAFGHTPLSAYDGLQGVVAARELQPDLIICDIHLPRARVLLLDAAPDGGGLVASILVHYGYALAVAADAEQAAHCARQQFDLLLCDADTAQSRHTAFVPAVLERHRAAWAGLPLVLITSAESDTLDGLLPPGWAPAVLLAHPLEPQQLAGALEECMKASTVTPVA